jgi:NTP pyrophosphatase (non-canonical NTP hydrolase)
MDFKEIIKRAVEVREKYSEFETKKYGREWSREQIAQGFVGDIGDLMKLVMAKEGLRKLENVDERLKHELADCLWSIIVLADKYGIDIEGAFLETMVELEGRLSSNNNGA